MKWKTPAIFVLPFAVILVVFLLGAKDYFKPHTPDVSEQRYVHITYAQAVNGYQVSVDWMPLTEYYWSLVGPAILSFEQGDKSFTVTNNYFALPLTWIDVIMDSNGMVSKVLEPRLQLNYRVPPGKEPALIAFEEPFFFLDLNFDNKMELICALTGQAQRGGRQFEVYVFDDWGNFEPACYQITREEPYNQLDDFSELDRKKKEIHLYGSGGLCSNTYYTYSFEDSPYQYGYRLTSVIREERDDARGKCFEHTYSVTAQKETLVSTKELK